MLKTCWVQISNVPTIAREVAAVKELASLVGQPIVVDELSLVKDEPMRVKVNCRNPDAIRCTIEVFFNKEGKQIKFMAERGFGKTQGTRGGPSGSGGGNDDEPNRKDKNGSKDHKGKKKNDKFDRMRRIDREQESSHGDSQDAMEEVNVQG